MLDISHEFVEHWVGVHDDKFRWSEPEQVEKSMREWLAKQSEPKYFDKEHFVRLGKWNRSVGDASDNAWLEYVDIMRDLSRRLGVSLRELDKALWAYDK